MKLTEALSRHYKWTKYTTNEKSIEFKPETRLELKKTVAGTQQKFNSNACIQELFVMLGCLKQNEFAEGSCGNEIGKYKSCNENYFTNRLIRKSNERTGTLIPGAKHLSPPQLNSLMKKFPPKKN